MIGPASMSAVSPARAFGRTIWNFPQTATSANPRIAGVLGGGTLGFNKQIDRWVVGVEGDIALTNAKGGQSCQDGVNNFNVVQNCNNDVHILATAAARVGYTWLDRILVYGKLGGAWTDNSLDASCNTDSQFFQGGCFPTNDQFGNVQDLTVSDPRFGVVAGAGFELALTPVVVGQGRIRLFELRHEDHGAARHHPGVHQGILQPGQIRPQLSFQRLRSRPGGAGRRHHAGQGAGQGAAAEPIQLDRRLRRPHGRRQAHQRAMDHDGASHYRLARSPLRRNEFPTRRPINRNSSVPRHRAEYSAVTTGNSRADGSAASRPTQPSAIAA